MNARTALSRSLVLPILISAVQAQSWESVSVTPGVGAEMFESNPTDAAHLAALSFSFAPQHAVTESFDGGFTWSVSVVPAVAEFDQSTAIAFEADGSLVILGRASGEADGRAPLIRRTNAGQWEVGGPRVVDLDLMDVGATHLVSSASGVTAVALQATDSSFYTPRASVHVTGDDGATWQQTWSIWHSGQVGDLGLTQTTTGQDRLLYATFDTTFGFTADLFSYELGGSISSLIFLSDAATRVVPGRVAPGILHATPSSANLPMSFRRTDDGGETWTNLTLPEFTPDILRGQVDADLLVRRESDHDVWLSRDRGTTWDQLPPVPFSSTQGVRFFDISPDDRWLYASNVPGQFFRFPLHEPVGAVACASQPTGAGGPAILRALGSSSVAQDDLLLWTRGVLPNQFGIYIASLTPGNVPGAGGSFGTLCLGGSIGRFAPALTSGSNGEFARRLNLSAMATPTGSTAVQPGETWLFQSWFRDGINGVAGSNFSSAVAVTFQP